MQTKVCLFWKTLLSREMIKSVLAHMKRADRCWRASAWNTRRLRSRGRFAECAAASEFISSSRSPKTQEFMSVRLHLHFQNICWFMSCLLFVSASVHAAGRRLIKVDVKVKSVCAHFCSTVSEKLQTLQLMTKTLNKDNCHWLSFQLFFFLTVSLEHAQIQ